MLARIVDNKWVYIEQITVPESDLLDKKLSVKHPRAKYIDSAGFFDGVFHKFNKYHNRLARPLLAELTKICKGYGMPFTIADDRPPLEKVQESLITPDLLTGVKLYDYQLEAIRSVIHNEVGIISANTGSGKCLGRGTKVKMYDGSVKYVEDIVVDDKLMGPDSLPRVILSTCCGNDNLYKIAQKNGDDYVVNSSHILVLKKTRERKGGPKGTEIEIDVNSYLSQSKRFKHIHKGFKTGVDYQDAPVPLDPYFIGLWLGDGRHDDASFTVNRGDAELFEYLDNFATLHNLVAVRTPDPRENADQVAIRLYKGIHAPKWYKPSDKNPIRDTLRKLDLLHNKHVPDLYKINSRSVRLGVLAGFVDADGSVVHGVSIDITHRDNQIIHGIIDIARSVGYRVSWKHCKKKCTTTGYVGDYIRVRISGDLTELQTLLLYKQFRKPKNRKNPLVYGISVEPFGYGEYHGFQIDGDGKFLLGDYTVTHNTEIMSGIVKVVNRPTVILCDMTIIVDQIKERLELREATKEVGMFYAGKRPNGQQVIVGSFQSLIIPTPPKKKETDTPEKYKLKCRAFNTRRKNARNLRAIIGKCDLLLVDECDIATSKRWKQLFWHWFKGRRRYGFSGTPFDPAKPVENLVLKEHLGSIIFHVPREEVEKNKRIVPVSYTAIAFGDETMIRDKSAYDIAMKEQMIENTSFHTLVSKIAIRTTEDPTCGTLILVESQPLGYALESMIEGSKFICGDHRMKERKKAIAAFESRETQVLIGGKIIKRGLDLQGGCESLIIATGGKLASDFGQKIGRAVRVNERGFAQIYDFFFLGNHYLYGHSRKRLKAIVEMGYPAKVVFKHGVVEAGKFIRSRFRRPKPK